MKISFILAALILLGCGILGWRTAQQVSVARQKRESLMAEAHALGVNTDDLSQKDPARHLARRSRAGGTDREAETKAFALRLIAFGNQMRAMEKSGQEPDEEMQKQIFEIIGTMLKLDAAQLKQLVAELRASPDLDGESRSQIVGFATMMLAGEHPAAALALYSESSDLAKDKGMSGQVISSALAKLAETDPAGAMDWIRKNSEAHKDLINDQVKIGILNGAAKQDPKLAFSLLGELGLANNTMAATSVANTAITPSQKTAVVEAMRDYLAKNPDSSSASTVLAGTLGGLASRAMIDGYDSAIEWINQAKLTPSEVGVFAGNLLVWQNKEDTGRWIDWMSDKLPADQSGVRVQQMVSQWTQQDYKAAGAWINGSKDGPVKETAIVAYATAVAPYEPESAAQWALALPEGQQKTTALNQVYDQWKQKDPVAAASFAKAHGLGQ